MTALFNKKNISKKNDVVLGEVWEFVWGFHVLIKNVSFQT